MKAKEITDEILRECEYSPAILKKKLGIADSLCDKYLKDYMDRIDVRFVNITDAMRHLKNIEITLFNKIEAYHILQSRGMQYSLVKAEKEINELQSKYSSFNIYNS